MSSSVTQPSPSQPNAKCIEINDGDEAKTSEQTPIAKNENALQNIIATFLKQNPSLSTNFAIAIQSVFNQKNHSNYRIKQTNLNNRLQNKPTKSNKVIKKKKKDNDTYGKIDLKLSQKQKIIKPVKIKEPKSKSLYEKRQTIIINSSEVKRVLTPICNNAISDGSNETIIELPKNYDLIEQHKRLEVFENRIINGLISKYGHPAYSIKAAEEEENLNLNETEMEKADRYECMETPQKIPNFWPERVWDKPNDIFNKEESDKMKKLIVSSREVLELSRRIQRAKSTSSITKSSVYRSNSTQKIKQNIKKNYIVQLSMIDFETDPSSEETDF